MIYTLDIWNKEGRHRRLSGPLPAILDAIGQDERLGGWNAPLGGRMELRRPNGDLVDLWDGLPSEAPEHAQE